MTNKDDELSWITGLLVVICLFVGLLFIADSQYGNEGSNEPAVTPIFPTERN